MSRGFCYTCVALVFMGGCSLRPLNPGQKDFNEAVSLFNAGDCEKAVLKFKDALQKEPALQEGYLYMAECSLKAGDFKQALQMAQKAIPVAAENNKNKDTLKTLCAAGGQSAFEKQDYDAAIQFLKESIALDQNDSRLHLLLGKALLERGNKGDLKQAIIEFKAAVNNSLSLDTDLARIRSIFFGWAKKYASQGDLYTESRCYLAYTENFNSTDAEAYLALGKVFLRMGNPVGALYYAKKAYALDHENKAVIELLNDLNTPSYP